MSDFHKTYRELVATEADRQLVRWGDDCDNGKQPLFLLGVINQTLGGVAQAVIGNAGETKEANATTALERLVRLGAAIEALYVLVAKLDERGWNKGDL